MAKAPKLADITSLDDFSHWLADTIQEKAAKENAGFVQIARGFPNRNDLVINNGQDVEDKPFSISVVIASGDES